MPEVQNNTSNQSAPAAAPKPAAAGAPSSGNRGFGGRGRSQGGYGGGFGGNRPGPGGNRPGGNRPGGNRPGGRGPGRGRDRFEEKDGFNEAVLDLRRVTRVVAGGKRFRFRATVVIGDGKGKVGVGVAKGSDVQQSIAKAKTAAKRALVTVRIVNGTIPHEVKAKFSAAEVILRPAKEGHGLMAGGATRSVMLLAGIKDITAKCLGGTKNKLTNALAAIEALKQLKAAK